VTEVMLEIGFDKPNQSDTTKCGQALKGLNGSKHKRTGSKRLVLVPPIR
jgi:hypothetical protein